MKKILPSVVTTLMLINSSLAFAATEVSGTIKAIDPGVREIVLSNGKVYYLAPSIDISKLKVGEKVTVSNEVYAPIKYNMVSKITTD